MTARLFIGGLAWETTDSTLKTRFEEFGDVISATVVVDRETGNVVFLLFVI